MLPCVAVQSLLPSSSTRKASSAAVKLIITGLCAASTSLTINGMSSTNAVKKK